MKRRSIVTILGYREDPYEPTGLNDLHYDVLRPIENENIIALAPREYTLDAQKLVAELVRRRVDSIAAITYSHGQSAMKAIAKECAKHRIEIDMWIACDPVPRPSWLPRKDCLQWLSVRALVPRQRIPIPLNVKYATGIYQDVSIPNGAKFRPNGVTVIGEMQKVARSHTQMDNSPEMYELCRKEITRWILQDLTV